MPIEKPLTKSEFIEVMASEKKKFEKKADKQANKALFIIFVVVAFALLFRLLTLIGSFMNTQSACITAFITLVICTFEFAPFLANMWLKVR